MGMVSLKGECESDLTTVLKQQESQLAGRSDLVAEGQ